MKTDTKKINPKLAQLLKEGYTVQGEPRFYLSEAGLPAADLRLFKKGQKPVYLKGVYGKDENVPGGAKHRFGKTEKKNGNVSLESLKAAQKAKARAKSVSATDHHRGTSQKDRDGSAKGAGLGAGKTKKDHK